MQIGLSSLAAATASDVLFPSSNVSCSIILNGLVHSCRCSLEIIVCKTDSVKRFALI